MSSQQSTHSVLSSTTPPADGRGHADGVRAAGVAEHPQASVPRREATLDKSAVLDQAYDEFCQRCEAGEAIDPDAFCERFPNYKTSLRRLLGAHRWFEANSYVLAELKPDQWPQAGGSFLGFTLVRELGRGAFARVFLAAETALGGRRVAVKISEQGGVEAETLGRLSHPNIVPVHSIREDPATRLTAVCMPYLGSATLCDVLDYVYAVPAGRQWAASILQAVRAAGGDDASADAKPPAVLRNGTYADGVLHLAVQLTDALAFVHARDVCHGDLKPSNVLLTPAGRPMLLDFNLSVSQQAADARVGGTLPYMSPEQLAATEAREGEPAPCLDARSDLFSLGVMLYELLSGCHPFGPISLKLSYEELRDQLRERQPRGCRPLQQLNPRVGKALARLVESCLAYEPSARPQSAVELAEALRKQLSPARRARRWVSARRVFVAGTLAFGLLAGVAANSAFVPKEPYSDHHLRLGEAALIGGNYQQAIGHFDKALETQPDLARGYFLRGRAFQRQDQMEAARANYDKAAELAPDGPVKACLGYYYNWAKEHQTAATLYREAVDLGFAPPAVLNNLGYSNLMLAKADEAQTHLEQALQQDPALQAAHFNLALVDALRINGQKQSLPVEGIKHVETALKLGPATADLCYCAAFLYAAATRQDVNHTPFALDQMEKALGLGCEPRKFEAFAQFEALAKEPRFNALLNRPAARNPAVSTPRLLDPLQDGPTR